MVNRDELWLRQAQTMTEKELQTRVELVARRYRWLAYHPYDSRKSTPGYPDLTMVRDSQVIFAELKSHRGVISRYQQDWLAKLGEVEASTQAGNIWGTLPVQVFVWRPMQILDGTVESILR